MIISEEEKKAVETLKDLASTIYYGDMNFIESDDLKIILNLIEKQQKEIETYKLLNANIEKDNKRQSIAIIEYQDLLENSISKDKIRNKIKEYKGLKEIDKMAYEEEIKQKKKGNKDV